MKKILVLYDEPDCGGVPTQFREPDGSAGKAFTLHDLATPGLLIPDWNLPDKTERNSARETCKMKKSDTACVATHIARDSNSDQLSAYTGESRYVLYPAGQSGNFSC